MDIDSKCNLLGGMSPRRFMQRHWQKKPLLVRSAVVPEAEEAISPVTRGELFALAGRDDVESRLLVQTGERWSMHTGPMNRGRLPPLKQPRWSLLVQGVDLHSSAAHRLLQRFRFVPDARLDDVMVSYATDGGGVGPHFDSYDVFLLQVQGNRRWRVGRVTDPSLREGVPLKLLEHFEPEAEYLLEPGDMLYLPPDWAHDGVAEGECMTCSIGFRAPGRGELARDVMQRALDAWEAPEGRGNALYKDPRQDATDTPGLIPVGLQGFAADAVARLLRNEGELHCALGEVLSEPKPHVWFEAAAEWETASGVMLSPRSRMLYDRRRVYINGESFEASGRDARLMRALSDRRRLDAGDIARLSEAARSLLDDWARSGWLEALPDKDREGAIP